MTASVKDELSRLSVTKTCDRRAEISALLRFAGGLHIVGGRVVVEAELDTGSTARRLRRDIAEVYGHASEVQVLAGSGLRKGNRYIVRVVKDGDAEDLRNDRDIQEFYLGVGEAGRRSFRDVKTYRRKKTWSA